MRSETKFEHHSAIEFPDKRAWSGFVNTVTMNKYLMRGSGLLHCHVEVEELATKLREWELYSFGKRKWVELSALEWNGIK